METTPPKWADRFLSWYCNPDLLEEIQGDAHELYYERVREFGKSSADWKYIWDVLRFFRLSNIRRTSNENRPHYLQIVWHLNVKLAIREAFKNKFSFFVKVLGLTTSLSFTLLLIGFILQEFSYDLHDPDHDRIYRVGASVDLDGITTHYAVSPFALADELAYEIPEIEAACWVSYHHRPSLKVGNNLFRDEVAWLVNESFSDVFTLGFINGDSTMLSSPNKIFLTASTANKFFNAEQCVGEVVDLGWISLEVAGVIKDLPTTTHAQFDVLISAATFNIRPSWHDLNAYTYLKVRKGVDVDSLKSKVASVLADHNDDIANGNATAEELTIQPIFENISSIHLSAPLQEDIVKKRNPRNLYILITVCVLFFLSGLINYFNVSLSELTAYIKKIGILQVFGGASANHHKVNTTNLVLTLGIALPLSSVIMYATLPLLHATQTFSLDPAIFQTTWFVAVAGILLIAFIISSKLNSYFISRTHNIIAALKGKCLTWTNGFQLREVLVSIQLSFSIVMMALMILILDQFKFIDSKDKGFDISKTLVIKLPHDRHAEGVEFQSKIRMLAGIKNVDGSSFHTNNLEKREFFEIETSTGSRKMLVDYLNCGYEYLDMMKIQFISGRNFDSVHSTDAKHAYIINEAAAKQFGWTDPLGKIINGPINTDRERGEVIGVVKDFNLSSLHKVIEPLIIFLGNEDWGTRHAYVKLNPLHSPDIVSKIGSAYQKSFSSSAMEWEYLESQYKSLYRDDLEVSNILQIGLMISIFISCLGILSLSALLAELRSHEMGVRKIIGANQFQIILIHLKPFLKFVAIALVIAYPAIYYFSNYWLSNFAYHITLDAWYFLFPAFVAMLIVTATAIFHAFKVSLVNPIKVLRAE